MRMFVFQKNSNDCHDESRTEVKKKVNVLNENYLVKYPLPIQIGSRWC